MENIKDKIAKLLALADCPNENEAREALLKARELMAKHKLHPSDCKKAENIKVIKETIGVTCTAMTDSWALPLSAEIAAAYCCKAFSEKYKGEKTYTIGLIGLEDDFEICKRIFLYAYDCIKSYCKNEIHRSPWESASVYREACNAYGYGFARGVAQAFDEQEEKHQEWGLIMVVPQAVTDAASNLSERKGGNPGREKAGGYLDHYRAQGMQDGRAFDPTHRIEEG